MKYQWSPAGSTRSPRSVRSPSSPGGIDRPVGSIRAPGLSNHRNPPAQGRNHHTHREKRSQSRISSRKGRSFSTSDASMLNCDESRGQRSVGTELCYQGFIVRSIPSHRAVTQTLKRFSLNSPGWDRRENGHETFPFVANSLRSRVGVAKPAPPIRIQRVLSHRLIKQESCKLDRRNVSFIFQQVREAETGENPVRWEINAKS